MDLCCLLRPPLLPCFLAFVRGWVSSVVPLRGGGEAPPTALPLRALVARSACVGFGLGGSLEARLCPRRAFPSGPEEPKVRVTARPAGVVSTGPLGREGPCKFEGVGQGESEVGPWSAGPVGSVGAASIWIPRPAGHGRGRRATEVVGSPGQLAGCARAPRASVSFETRSKGAPACGVCSCR